MSLLFNVLPRLVILEKDMETHSSILAWEISWTEEPGWGMEVGATVHGVEKESDTT